MIERPKKLNIPQPKEMKRYKILVLGDAGVGKTQMLNQYCNEKFNANYNSTIAVDYQTKTVDQIQLNFWDFSGHPEFYEVRNEFYREADGILLVIDLSLKSSLNGLDMWLRECQENGIESSLIPIFVIGNKNDKSRSISEQDGYSWASQRKFPYYEVSSSEKKGFDNLFKDFIAKLDKK